MQNRPQQIASLLASPKKTARLYNKAFARMTAGDGYQPYGYDWPTIRLTMPGWAETLKDIGQAHNLLVMQSKTV